MATIILDLLIHKNNKKHNKTPKAQQHAAKYSNYDKINGFSTQNNIALQINASPKKYNAGNLTKLIKKNTLDYI